MSYIFLFNLNECKTTYPASFNCLIMFFSIFDRIGIKKTAFTKNNKNGLKTYESEKLFFWTLHVTDFSTKNTVTYFDFNIFINSLFG